MRIRVVAVANRIVLNAARAAAWNDGLERADLAGLKRSGDPARERQFVERVNPIRSVIEFPIGVPIRLLQRVPSTHTQLNRNNVGLPIRKMVRRAWEMRRSEEHTS